MKFMVTFSFLAALFKNYLSLETYDYGYDYV